MSKKTAKLLLVIISLAGSFLTFYVSNLIFSDIGNMFYGVGPNDIYAVASLPGFMLVPELIVLTLYVVRTTIKPEGKKQITRLYTVLLAVFSLLGFVSSILTGTIVYHSFVRPYPFPGYALIGVVLHAAILIFAIIARIECEKLPEDTKRQKISFIYIIYSAVVAILIFFTYNRLGAFLWAPVYVHWETLYMTFPFYISLLLPAGLLADNAYFLLDGFKKHPKLRTVNLFIIFGMTIATCIATVVIGSANTRFISVISPALALERLATLPIDVILQFGLLFIFCILFIIMSFSKKKAPGME